MIEVRQDFLVNFLQQIQFTKRNVIQILVRNAQIESLRLIINITIYSMQPYSYIEPYPYIEALDYSSKQGIVQAFPHLNDVNQNRAWPKNRKYDGVIIRSANDDNVHKAIKYGIWATTIKNRNKLSHLYSRANIQRTEVFLFFSVVKSGMFEGVARLSSNLMEQNFPYWWDDFSMKFKGYFNIQWLYLKDINFIHFEGLYNCDKQQLTKSKDCDQLDSTTTLEMLNLFQNKPMKNKWIFNDFPYMDKRQRQYTRRLQQPNLPNYQYIQQYNYYSNYNPQTISITQQVMKYKPQFPSYTELGFQMNPVSYKQNKK